ncbi:MAG: thrombospondin type 3 repeat-containing protein, partial [Deltaproteobacteria bacterium]|nr:thrombospondin type 3 repeat-containing protein [Deltaproteobacteria bacterium]
MSAFCTETPEGKRCARPCTDGSTCDPGHECVQVSAYGDMLFVCVHRAPRTCRPCVSAEDCVGSYGTAAMLCERLGGFGFCVAGCEDAAGCGGAGWSCVEARGGKRCTPDDGTCPCSARHAEGGVEGACFRTNDVGTCEGRFACLAGGGIGDCDAPEAAVEACNALDDDCDGGTDEDFVTAGECDIENGHGICKGAWVCKDGAQACDGRPPMPEVCNGIDDECDGETDEGFADMDADGLADCADPDVDGDGAANEADVCPYLADPDQLDNDHDGDGDACDADDDDDGVIDTLDGCPFVPNPDQIDIDHDGKGDACDDDIDGDGAGNATDNCPYLPNPGQEDANGNGVGDACDSDADGDGIPNAQDVCPLVADPAQLDDDHDGRGDACDCDADNDGVQNPAQGCPTACEKCDNCPLDPNPKQLDTDGDSLGDACDDDADGDGVPNGEDNCPGTPNHDQLDSNGNGLGDACEGDWDGDGVKNATDVCPWVPDPGQEDLDRDGAGDACDCDMDGDGLSNGGEDPAGDACIPAVPADNCPAIANPDQADLDGDGIGDACDPDRDGDKDPDATDCAPGDPWVHHAAPESCNAVDDNCNGVTDDPDAAGCKLRYWDGDLDGAGTLVAKCLCEAGGGFTADKPGDCNDADPAVHPGATEACANWRDDDCDAQVDEPGASGCAVLHKDADGDGYGADADSMCLCSPWNGYATPTGGDCNDLDKGVFPGQVESCNGKDDDCDAVADGTGSAGCTQFLLDADRDGFGNDADKLCLCKATAPYDAVKGGDCDDDAASSNPAAPEKCNTVDDDCDGATDEQAAAGCREHYMDGDGDGYGALAASKCLCAPAAPFTSTNPTDCNDADAAVSPGATEACNGVDDDCDAQADEPGAAGCETYWRDNDGDAYGVETDSRCLCAPSGKYVAESTGDCNDSDKAVYPGATELCNGE